MKITGIEVEDNDYFWNPPRVNLLVDSYLDTSKATDHLFPSGNGFFGVHEFDEGILWFAHHTPNETDPHRGGALGSSYLINGEKIGFATGWSSNASAFNSAGVWPDLVMEITLKKDSAYGGQIAYAPVSLIKQMLDGIGYELLPGNQVSRIRDESKRKPMGKHEYTPYKTVRVDTPAIGPVPSDMSAEQGAVVYGNLDTCSTYGYVPVPKENVNA